MINTRPLRVYDAREQVGHDPATLTLTAQVETQVLAPGERKREEGGVIPIRRQRSRRERTRFLVAGTSLYRTDISGTSSPSAGR